MLESSKLPFTMVAVGALDVVEDVVDEAVEDDVEEDMEEVVDDVVDEVVVEVVEVVDMLVIESRLDVGSKMGSAMRRETRWYCLCGKGAESEGWTSSLKGSSKREDDAEGRI